MLSALPEPLRHLVAALTRLPGVGEKTALRYALHLLSRGESAMAELREALAGVETQMGWCTRCGNLSSQQPDEEAVCDICLDPKRDASTVCVVARVPDLIAVERSGALRGHYCVLGMLLSPLDGVGPDELPLARLRKQIQAGPVRELVLATPPSVEGEATALFLAREFGKQLQVTRIASGIPHGGDLEFADPITLGRAMSGRRGLDS